MLHTIDLHALAAVTGGVDTPKPPTTGQQVASYAGACASGALTGAAFGAGVGALTGAGALPGAGLGAVTGCLRGMINKPTPAY